MDRSRFDAWTRRRFGVVTGGLFAATLGFATRHEAAAKNKRKKKRRKKRCKRLGDTCQPGGKRKCCGALACDEVSERDVFVCCKELGAPCMGSDQCCLPGTCFLGNCGLL